LSWWKERSCIGKSLGGVWDALRVDSGGSLSVGLFWRVGELYTPKGDRLCGMEISDMILGLDIIFLKRGRIRQCFLVRSSCNAPLVLHLTTYRTVQSSGPMNLCTSGSIPANFESLDKSCPACDYAKADEPCGSK
jgi:hypothetical protein